MSHDSEVMQAVLAGERPSAEAYREYYRRFHEEHEAATEESMRAFRDEQGRTSYQRLVAAVQGRVDRALDVGCGNGPLLELLLETHPGAALSGIDLSKAEIERAKSRLPVASVRELVVSHAENLPFAAASFDAVFSHLVFMLVPDIAAVFREARRVLTHEGRLAFLIGRPPDEPKGPTVELLSSIPGWIREFHPRFTPVNPGDDRAFSRDAMTEVLSQAGFSRVSFDDFTVHRAMDGDDVWAWINRRYYVGSLAPDAQRALREKVDTWMGGRSMNFSESLRIVAAE